MFSFKIVVIMNPADRFPHLSCTTAVSNNLQPYAAAEILVLFDVLGTVGVVPHEANGNVGTYVVCKTINLYLLTPWSTQRQIW
ncbi:hypothetical protein V1477_009252 [Vespula maculifrons]|uniref:Uncharacterized protein n=1 Tax=Vespula maculifrons TaxID=7453 RepID=A0ABD2C983_VESMC